MSNNTPSPYFSADRLADKPTKTQEQQIINQKAVLKVELGASFNIIVQFYSLRAL